MSEPTYALLFSQIDDELENVGGKQVLGVLDDNLKSAFCEMAQAESAFEELHAETKERAVTKAAGSFVDHGGDVQLAMGEILRHNPFESGEQAAAYYHSHAMFQELFWQFWNRVRGEFNGWNARLAIRKGFTVVYLGKRVDCGE